MLSLQKDSMVKEKNFSPLGESLVQEYQNLEQLCKELDLDTELPSGPITDTLVLLLGRLVVKLAQLSEQELELEED